MRTCDIKVNYDILLNGRLLEVGIGEEYYGTATEDLRVAAYEVVFVGAPRSGRKNDN